LIVITHILWLYTSLDVDLFSDEMGLLNFQSVSEYTGWSDVCVCIWCHSCVGCWVHKGYKTCHNGVVVKMALLT